MTVTRRRALMIAAAFASTPLAARTPSRPHTWTGRAFGAEAQITLSGPSERVERAFAEIQTLLGEVEGALSLYQPSELTRLNATGLLDAPSRHMRAILAATDIAYRQTNGLFDPTVQPLWRALATGGDADAARILVGWDRVRHTAAQVNLDAGQALTFNGIAQGYATDAATAILRGQGFESCLVNIGEYRAIGGPFQLGFSDPAAGHIGTRTVTDHAIATSSPTALHLGPAHHILSPTGLAPHWSTVTVEADTATTADALSTALTLASADIIAELRNVRGISRVTLVGFDGDVSTI
ncbi:FAD:protein FMN transferase [Litoreibacter roseus]|uniref:FAD:protein FMN transferase n=1 Tax=Litoreibacter roseus TaxID=2601869 RepID=A0A6N6JG92_9RHOB|nr:FAD:protein FMN transferase [Litoreibacter roseus]GFE64232.1 FAD:protein FMN transferase [Litoreibacter roseus]